ncbi:MAG: DEAD/DEAH box helicase, partial [Halobacteria archaeon]|nr:DEAD/DEAH box helicase [Halobacteria archaeon]
MVRISSSTSPDAPEVDDDHVLEIFEPSLREWWVEEFGDYIDINGGYFTPPQKEAVPKIHNDENVLICAPTGSGKTLASFSSIINELFIKSKQDELENSVYCLYISPLKSLANDIHRNLEVPLEGIDEIAQEKGYDEVDIRHAIRHGDTSSNERQKMLRNTP